MVNILLSDVLILLLPVILWVIGMVTRLPITVLFAGFGFIAVGVLFLSSGLPSWVSVSYGLVGVFIIIGVIYTLK